ncbi:hypothetical protein M426DRAFT_85442 [Hypoxylon sp. CI-4A]|nr:hypothetical protein M426DRAFT_85442 [Hypoxylon sp. CI-4A]
MGSLFDGSPVPVFLAAFLQDYIFLVVLSCWIKWDCDLSQSSFPCSERYCCNEFSTSSSRLEEYLMALYQSRTLISIEIWILPM